MSFTQFLESRSSERDNEYNTGRSNMIRTLSPTEHEELDNYTHTIADQFMKGTFLKLSANSNSELPHGSAGNESAMSQPRHGFPAFVIAGKSQPELPHPVTHYNSKRYPFIYVPFFEEAKRVAYVNLEDFVAYCRRIGTRPQSRTVLFTNTGRCGSTLLAQMLSLDSVSVCYAEPHVFKVLSVGYHEGIYSEDFTRAAVSAAITYFRRDVPTSQICVIKTTSSEIRLVPLTSNVSNLQHIFMFRRNGVSSMEKAILRDKAMRYLLELYKLFPLFCDVICCRLIAGDGDCIKKLRPRNAFEHAAVNYAAPYSHYLKNKEKFVEIVFYHDLMNVTEATLKNIFEKLHIPTFCVEAAMKCKEYDSQDGTFLSRKALAGIKTTAPTELQKERLIQFCEAMEIPKFILLGDE